MCSGRKQHLIHYQELSETMSGLTPHTLEEYTRFVNTDLQEVQNTPVRALDRRCPTACVMHYTTAHICCMQRVQRFSSRYEEKLQSMDKQTDEFGSI